MSTEDLEKLWGIEDLSKSALDDSGTTLGGGKEASERPNDENAAE